MTDKQILILVLLTFPLFLTGAFAAFIYNMVMFGYSYMDKAIHPRAWKHYEDAVSHHTCNKPLGGL